MIDPTQGGITSQQGQPMASCFCEEIVPGTTFVKWEDAVQLRFASPQIALSSAVSNGGFCRADNFLNMQVPRNPCKPLESPVKTLKDYAALRGIVGTTVAMMTAASMRSCRLCVEAIEQYHLAVLVTSGTNNARRIGDEAEQQSLWVEKPSTLGTINIAVVSSVPLLPAAMVEAITLVTEAKAAALQDLCIFSAVSDALATGTGTDATALFASEGPSELPYAGKHTLFGERLGVLTHRAITQSLELRSEPHL